MARPPPEKQSSALLGCAFSIRKFKGALQDLSPSPITLPTPRNRYYSDPTITVFSVCAFLQFVSDRLGEALLLSLCLSADLKGCHRRQTRVTNPYLQSTNILQRISSSSPKNFIDHQEAYSIIKNCTSISACSRFHCPPLLLSCGDALSLTQDIAPRSHPEVKNNN